MRKAKPRFHHTFPQLPWLDRIYHILLLALPPLLYFSYYPLISLGHTDSMNLELSLPLIWLVIFDLVGAIILFKARPLLDYSRIWPWLLFPLFLTVSVAWSLNPLRGFLTVAILWLIYFAVFCFFALRHIVQTPENYARLFWRIFFISSLVACAWCWLQSILDLVGVPQEATLMCNGCTSIMFGFPHPSGFAIEPQFMGNLLLAPTLLSAWFAFNPVRKKFLVIFFILAATLFLTFSRGAIYAFLLGLLLLTVWQIIQSKSPRSLWTWPILLLAFLFTLNAQGIMTMLGPTSDTYVSGIAKSIHQLSLGQIDFRPAETASTDAGTTESSAETTITTETSSDSAATEVAETTETTETNATTEPDQTSSDQSVFDGYVAASTNVRLSLTSSALSIWQTSPNLMVFGVGLGGAGQALYNAGLSPAPKEIVQNQYASLLLETGLLGVLLALFTFALAFRIIYRSPLRLPLIALLLAYAVTLFFFSGLPNALQIYLTPPLILLFSAGKSSSDKFLPRVVYKIPAQPRARRRK